MFKYKIFGCVFVRKGHFIYNNFEYSGNKRIYTNLDELERDLEEFVNKIETKYKFGYEVKAVYEVKEVSERS